VTQIMTIIDSSKTIDSSKAQWPVLAAPEPPARPLSLWRFLIVLRDSMIATFEAGAYDRDFTERQLPGGRSLLIVNTPAAIKHILLDNAENYTKSEASRRVLEPALGRGIFTSEGEAWRRQRRIMAPSFDHRSILGYVPIITHVVEEMLEQWDALPSGTVVDVGHAMGDLSANVSSQTMFSRDAAGLADVAARVARYQAKMRPRLIDLLGMPHSLQRLFGGERAPRSRMEFDHAFDQLIAARKQGALPDRRDLLARLISARDSQTGDRMTAEEVRDQAVTIFLAGYETTSLALTWTWYLLDKHPTVSAKLHAELDAVLGGRSPQPEDLPRLSYTRMIVEESLRLYPLTHTFSRQAMRDDEILGRRVRARTTILISPWLLHRRPSIWNAPERFDPERFAPPAAAKRARYSYIPFGAGQRICLGMALAMAETTLVLAMLAQRYRLRLCRGHIVDAQGLITLRPRFGMRMILERRH
jgi:cytochrome P450